MAKLLCIVGPTGTGKTQKAIELSHKQPSVLISADSRQVYRGMDIVTGKDHPLNIPIYGIDIVDPDQPCSVSVWYEAVMPHVEQAWVEGKQVIVVGGTGLYVKALTEGIPTLKIPVNQSLRDQLALLRVSDLQAKLQTLSPAKFVSMNHSDQCNPRRLIRAIEVATSNTKLESIPASQQAGSMSHESRILGYKYSDLSIQRNKIYERVLARLKLGAVEETKNLLTRYDSSLPSMSALGYKSIIEFLDGKLTESEMVESWVSDELSYAKRQMTWFRKQPTIWYDVDTIGDL